MAYTDIPTVAVGDLYSADNFNTYLRDNFAAGIPDKFTAKGDIAFGEGTDTIGILSVGSNGQWLETDAGETLGAKWAAPTGFFDWFTFGAFTSDTWDDRQVITLSYETPIIDIHTLFSIPDTASRLFWGTLMARRNDSGASPVDPADYVNLHSYSTDDYEIYLQTRVFGDTGSTSWAWSSQTGFFKCDGSGRVYVGHENNKGFNVTIKVWGYM